MSKMKWDMPEYVHVCLSFCTLEPGTFTHGSFEDAQTAATKHSKEFGHEIAVMKKQKGIITG